MFIAQTLYRVPHAVALQAGGIRGRGPRPVWVLRVPGLISKLALTRTTGSRPLDSEIIARIMHIRQRPRSKPLRAKAMGLCLEADCEPLVRPKHRRLNDALAGEKRRFNHNLLAFPAITIRNNLV